MSCMNFMTCKIRMAQGNCIYAAHGACCSVIWYIYVGMYVCRCLCMWYVCTMRKYDAMTGSMYSQGWVCNVLLHTQAIHTTCIFAIYPYIHPWVHTYLHTFLHSFMHTVTYVRTCTCGYKHMYIHADRQTDRRTDKQTDRQTDKQTYLHTHIHTRTHTHIHTYIYTYIHTCIHTYIHK